MFIIGILAGEFIYTFLRQGREMSYLGIQPRAMVCVGFIHWSVITIIILRRGCLWYRLVFTLGAPMINIWFTSTF